MTQLTRRAFTALAGLLPMGMLPLGRQEQPSTDRFSAEVAMARFHGRRYGFGFRIKIPRPNTAGMEFRDVLRVEDQAVRNIVRFFDDVDVHAHAFIGGNLIVRAIWTGDDFKTTQELAFQSLCRLHCALGDFDVRVFSFDRIG